MNELHRLAESVGVVTGFQSTTGEWIAPSDDDLLATLQRLGVDIERADQAPNVLSELDRLGEREPIPPVAVAWDGWLQPVRVRGVRHDARLELESGEVWSSLPVRDDHLVVARALPFGRHELVVHAGGDAAGAGEVEARCTVFSAPTVAWRPAAGSERRWGVFAPTYALRRRAAPSAIGDLTDLEAAFDWLHGRGGQVVVTLPMLATFLDEPAEPSPYAPVSRRMWNELFADVRAVAARVGIDLGSADGELVEYAEAWAPRRRALAQIAERMIGDADLEHWAAQHPLVEEYARFRAAGAVHGRNWRAWPSRLPTDVDPAEVRFHVTAQWLVDRQLGRLDRKVSGRGQLLALDMPLGSHPDGFDVWREGDLFVDGVSVGAPPDSFFTLGQDWGFPPVHPLRSRREGHAFLQSCIRHHVQHAGLLRVDHILGLLRLYWVRADAGAKRGVYVRYPLEELLAVIALEASRVGAVVVGENLGTVPPEVTEAMTRHGVLGCAVSQFDVFEVLDGRPMPPPPAASVATLNTHDTATFAGFWSGEDATDRADLGLLDAAELSAEQAQRSQLREAVRDRVGLGAEAGTLDAAAALLDVAARSDANLVVINVEDGWQEPSPQNVPGTTTERPNWRRRVAVAVDDWDHDAGLCRLVDVVAAARPGWGTVVEGPPSRLAQDLS